MNYIRIRSIVYFESEVQEKMAHKDKKKKKHQKYLGEISGDDYDLDRIGSIYIEDVPLLEQGGSGRRVPKKLVLKRDSEPGLFLGGFDQYKKDHYVGIPQGEEGNVVVIGGNGSGKSAGIAKPTLRMWQGAICATDVKGELSDYYVNLSEALGQNGIAIRPFIIFDPTEMDGPSYDPFWWLLKDDTNNLVNNIQEIALAIIPIQPEERDPFWTESERGVLAGALLYYFQIGLSFSETICRILEVPLSVLCEELSQCNDVRVRILIGQMAEMKKETIASIDRGLRNKIMLFAVDPYISHAFRGIREGANCFNWDDLNEHNIFLRIPADKMDQWSCAINLLYTQLIRYLERRPEKYTASGANNIQTLLLMDEFARFGKLEMITSAMSTLRSKNVNICIMIQSVAQLDSIYGQYERRVIFDNCQYKAILRADDAETGKYLSDLIGVCTRRLYSVGTQYDAQLRKVGYNSQISEIQSQIVSPNKLSTLKEVLLLTPHGFCCVDKFQPNSTLADRELYFTVRKQVAPTKDIKTVDPSNSIAFRPNDFPRNEGAKMLTIDDRNEKASKRIDESKRQERLAARHAREEQRKKDQRRNYLVGELVISFFPELKLLEPGNKAENAIRFRPLKAFLFELASDPDLVEALKQKVARRDTINNDFNNPEQECVSGHGKD